MHTGRPSYRERGESYQADACRPVAEAVAAGTLRYHALVRGQYPGTQLPTHALPGMRNLGFWNVAKPQPWGLDWHRNEGIELTFLERGRLEFAVQEASYSLQAGDLTFTRPWQPHRLGNPHVMPSRLHWVILDVGVQRPHQPWQWPSWFVLTPRDRKELTTMLRHAAKPVWRAGEELRACFRRIASAVEGDQAADSSSRLAAYLNELFVLVLELLRQGEVPFDESLATALTTVELFWQDVRQNLSLLARPWSVSEMARSCGMGVTQFTRLCRESANMTPMECLGYHRVEAAKRTLLEQSRATVTQVGLACGFGSSQYFAKVFREVTGCTPREFRRRQGLGSVANVTPSPERPTACGTRGGSTSSPRRRPPPGSADRP